MNLSRDQRIETLQTALNAAHANENRWMEISAEFSGDAERMEQWSSTAKLRRFEVERVGALLAGAAESSGLAQPVRSETIEAENRIGETA
jgi:hypothetical protein